MSTRPRSAPRERSLAGAAPISALVTSSLVALGALYLWAGGDRSFRKSGDALGLALLRAEVERQPDDARARCRLVEAELLLGLYGDAERTLAPALRAASAAPEIRLLALEAALGAFRAAVPGKAERRAAEETALARLESLVLSDAIRDHVAEAARVARELGRPDVAARAYERAALLEPDPRAAIDFGVEALDAYRAADDGSQALRLAEDLMKRFPAEQALLRRAQAIALSQDDVARAAQIAERLVLATPDDPAAHLSAARLETWAARPASALRHWMWLARRGALPEAGTRALELARALRDGPAVAELLIRRGRRAPLSRTAIAELIAALSTTEAPGRAIAALRAQVAAHPRSAAAWDALGTELEQNCDLQGAVTVRLQERRRFGESLRSSIDVARLRWAAGRSEDALLELLPWLDSTPPAQVEYWDLVADVAWYEEADAIALRAYRALWEAGRIGAAGTERLLLLSRAAGRTDELIGLGRRAWARLGEPRLLVLAMDEAVRAQRWGDVEAMARESSPSAARFASIPAYWMLRARLDEHEGRISAAFADYRRALEADPKSKAARSGVFWLLAGEPQGTSLRETLLAWGIDASDDSPLPLAPPDTSRVVSQVSRGVARAVGGALATESIASVVLVQHGVFARSGIAGGELEARAGLVAYLSRAPGLHVPDAETRASARFAISGLGGTTEITAGASVRPDGNVPQAGVARTQRFAQLGEARLEASLNEAADESLALRMNAVRTRAGGAVAIAEGQAYQRVAIDWKRWTARAGSPFGAGAVANVEIGWRTSSPDLVLRLSGSYQRNSLAKGPLPGALAAFATDAVIPSELALIGAGAGVSSLPLGPVRLTADAWMGAVVPRLRPAFRMQTGIAVIPFANGDLALSGFAANDRLGGGGNVGLTVSLAHRFGI